MKRILFILMMFFSSFISAQTYWFNIGIEHLEGKLPEISNYFSQDSYRLTNFPTLSMVIKGEDELTNVDMSMFSFALMGIALKNENGKTFAGYNTTTRSDKNLFVVQNRKLFEWSKTKYKKVNFHAGKQIGFDYFGTGDKFWKQSVPYVPGVDPGPYLSRLNLYGGIHGYFNANLSKFASIKIGTTLDASVGLLSFGLHASPKVKISIHSSRFEFSSDINYDVDYYYAPTQNVFKDVKTNIPNNSVLPTALRINLGIGFRFKNN